MKHDYDDDIKLDCEQALIYNLINYVQNEDHIERWSEQERETERETSRDQNEHYQHHISTNDRPREIHHSLST